MQCQIHLHVLDLLLQEINIFLPVSKLPNKFRLVPLAVELGWELVQAACEAFVEGF